MKPPQGIIRAAIPRLHGGECVTGGVCVFGDHSSLIQDKVHQCLTSVLHRQPQNGGTLTGTSKPASVILEMHGL
jgi:hypothetical protein